MVSSEPFTITSLRDDDGSVTVAPAGEIDINVKEPLLAALTAAIAAPGVQQVRIDMAGVTFLDSSALSALIVARKQAERQLVNYRLTNASGVVSRILEINGLAEYLNLDLAGDSGAA